MLQKVNFFSDNSHYLWISVGIGIVSAFLFWKLYGISSKYGNKVNSIEWNLDENDSNLDDIIRNKWNENNIDAIMVLGGGKPMDVNTPPTWVVCGCILFC